MFAAFPIPRFSFLGATIPFEEAKENDKATESQRSANNESQDWTARKPFTYGNGVREDEQPTQSTKQTNAANQQLHYRPDLPGPHHKFPFSEGLVVSIQYHHRASGEGA
jgi:hypothetical protein